MGTKLSSLLLWGGRGFPVPKAGQQFHLARLWAKCLLASDKQCWATEGIQCSWSWDGGAGQHSERHALGEGNACTTPVPWKGKMRGKAELKQRLNQQTAGHLLQKAGLIFFPPFLCFVFSLYVSDQKSARLSNKFVNTYFEA